MQAIPLDSFWKNIIKIKISITRECFKSRTMYAKVAMKILFNKRCNDMKDK